MKMEAESSINVPTLNWICAVIQVIWAESRLKKNPAPLLALICAFIQNEEANRYQSELNLGMKWKIILGEEWHLAIMN